MNIRMAPRMATGPLPGEAPRPLTGQTALVSGGATGIGAAIVLALAQAGATVAINHVDQESQARTICDRVAAAGGAASAVQADLRNAAQIAIMHDAVHSRYGAIDILVNNAGAYPRVDWLDLTEDQWTDAIETNLNIHYRLTRAVSPQMIARRHGRIINIGSVTASAGRAGLVAYSAAKAGLEASPGPSPANSARTTSASTQWHQEQSTSNGRTVYPTTTAPPSPPNWPGNVCHGEASQPISPLR